MSRQKWSISSTLDRSLVQKYWSITLVIPLDNESTIREGQNYKMVLAGSQFVPVLQRERSPVTSVTYSQMIYLEFTNLKLLSSRSLFMTADLMTLFYLQQLSLFIEENKWHCLRRQVRRIWRQNKYLTFLSEKRRWRLPRVKLRFMMR